MESMPRCPILTVTRARLLAALDQVTDRGRTAGVAYPPWTSPQARDECYGRGDDPRPV
ncbi:MAG: hypothetical protein M3Z20_09005 [Chloroflexota bacterium]|nr:hypothetical protein [Chloroflexota bacterium]